MRIHFKPALPVAFAVATFLSTLPLFAADEVVESANDELGLPAKDSPEVQW